MSALITNVEHALATAASDTVKVAKFVETSVLPALKTAKAEESTIESVTSLLSPRLQTSSEPNLRSLEWSLTPSRLSGLPLAQTA